MEPHVRARFTPQVAAAVAGVVGVDPDQIGENLGFESFVHAVERQGETIYVKSTWSGRRTPAQTCAELAFVRHLADGGASVAQPVPLANGDLVASVPADGGTFVVSACASAPGKRPEPGSVTDEHLWAWGRMIGQMHRLASEPACEPWTAERPTWIDELADLQSHASDPRVAERYVAQLDRLRGLPTGPDVFGLMHGDLHDGNVNWDGLSPTAFDFEDCLAFWYASDLAIVLYYTTNRHVQADGWQAAYGRFLTHLRNGYETTHALPDAAWDTLPLFIDFRETMLWLVCERSVAHDERGPAFQEWMDRLHGRIVSGEHGLGLRW